jgi:class 3 adenylate cyclase
MSTGVVRVPSAVHLEAKRLAAIRGKQAGELLADAWREYLANHRDQFAGDLEEAARRLRHGTPEDLAEFANRDVDTRAEEAAEHARTAEE